MKINALVDLNTANSSYLLMGSAIVQLAMGQDVIEYARFG